jgi:hypothetical protein
VKSLAVLLALFPLRVAYAEQVDTPAIPDAATYSLDIGSHVRSFRDTSAAILSDRPMAGPRVTLGRSLTSKRVPFRDLDLGVFARYTYATAGGAFFQTIDTTLQQHVLSAGIRVDAPLWWRFRLVGQGEAGMARTKLQVTTNDLMPVDDKAWAPYAAATLGTDFGLVQNPRFRMSIGLDVGYVLPAPVELRALPGDRPDEELSIATEFASLGKLDTRGWVYSMMVRGAF